MRFLDADIFERTQINLANMGLNPSSHLSLGVENAAQMRETAAQYSKLIHPWLPIISQNKIYNHLLNPLLPFRLDASFLYACMKMLVHQFNEGEDDPETQEYRAAMQLFQKVQFAGVFSLEVLQGCLLIATYEFGHAMYPALHVSIGACVKYALALGLDWQRISIPSSSSNWAEEEERRRTCWAVYLIERVANVGDRRQALLFPEPTASTLIPLRDTEWEAENAEPQTPPSLSSPAVNLGRFAGVTQSVYLLGKVFAHLADKKIDAEIRKDEILLLDRTIHGLLRYLDTNRGTKTSIICYQTAICCNAVALLYSPFTERSGPDQSMSFLGFAANGAMDNVAHMAYEMASDFLDRHDLYDYEYGDIPPFILPWVYHSAVFYMQLHKRDKSEGSKARLDALEKILKYVDGKWKAAGT